MRADLASDNRPAVPPNEWGPGYQLWQSVLNLLAQRGPEGTTSLVRVGSHLIILLVAVLVLVFSKVDLPAWDIAEESAEPAEAEIIDGALIPEYVADAATTEENPAESVALVRAAVPITLIPERSRLDVVTHTVTAGDTLYGIAQRYKLSAETIMFSNGLEKNPDLLRLGQQLVILPLNGIYHTVGPKDTIQSIAKAYKVTPEAIIQYPLNHLDAQNPTIVAGQKLVVPGGVKELPKPAVTVYQTPSGTAQRGTGVLIWPTSGKITQGYKPLHRALDIARSIGTPIKAADSGVVVVAGWSNSGYGYHIVIDHGNGLQTLYAHLSRIFVKRGTVVAKGGVIGNMGNTGRSTGPHLHFEVRKGGVLVNPVGYLP